jgi:hypothetical protein
LWLSAAGISSSGRTGRCARSSGAASLIRSGWPYRVQLEEIAKLIAEWLAWRGPEIDPLFCGIYQGKPINRLFGTTKAKLIIKEAATAAGVPPEDVAAFSGHSLCVGAAQDLLCGGIR